MFSAFGGSLGRVTDWHFRIHWFGESKGLMRSGNRSLNWRVASHIWRIAGIEIEMATAKEAEKGSWGTDYYGGGDEGFWDKTTR